jgi:hypothetical protein
VEDGVVGRPTTFTPITTIFSRVAMVRVSPTRLAGHRTLRNFS